MPFLCSVSGVWKRHFIVYVFSTCILQVCVKWCVLIMSELYLHILSLCAFRRLLVPCTLQAVLFVNP